MTLTFISSTILIFDYFPKMHTLPVHVKAYSLLIWREAHKHKQSKEYREKHEIHWHPMNAQSSRYINVRHCGGLSMVHLQLTDSLEIFVKRREFLPRRGVLSRC